MLHSLTNQKANANRKEYCPHCHQAIMQNKQLFSKALGDILLTVACLFPAGKEFHLRYNMDLTKSQYCNFQKLRYWGLIKKSYNPDGSRHGGYWELTSLVRYFIHGSRIPRVKYTFNNKVVSASDDDQITLSEAVGSYEIPSQWAEKARPMPALVQPDLFTSK